MDIWAVLFPILLADVVNPVLFAFMVYAAGTNRPVVLSSAMLLGHTAAYFGAGIVLALFMQKITAYLANPHAVDFVIGLVLGLALVWLAFASTKEEGKRPDEETPEFSAVSAFGFGALINFIGIPFALPYFAALDQVLKADFTSAQAVLMILSYNLVYALPFTIVPLLSLVMGARAKPVLARVNRLLDKLSAVLMPLLLGLIGSALIVDAIKYFVTGKPLF
jgi:cytochrome c biogenesis protein CcdA